MPFVTSAPGREVQGRPFISTIRPFGQALGNPNYEANQAKATFSDQGRRRSADQTVCCAYCGRYCKNPTIFAFLANVSEFMDAKDDNGMDDLGFFPVGSDCAKLLRKHDVPLYDFDNNRI